MSFDVYGYPLRQGYCEVHPEVHQSYPCSLCYAESKKVDDDKQMEKEHYRQMEIDHQRDMEIEEQKHSFARSQAIGFAEWIVANDYRATVGCKNWAKWNPASSTWIYRTTAKLLTEFIEWKKQQEGKGE